MCASCIVFSRETIGIEGLLGPIGYFRALAGYGVLSGYKVVWEATWLSVCSRVKEMGETELRDPIDTI